MNIRTCFVLALLACCAPPRAPQPSIDAKEIEAPAAAPLAIDSPAPSRLGAPAASPPTCFRAVVEGCYANAAEACEVAGCPDDCHPFVTGGSTLVDCADDAGARLESVAEGCVRIAEDHCHADRQAACEAVRCPIDVHRYCAELLMDGDTTFLHCAHNGGW